ncbi:hypothetical protein VB735_07500 [Halotia wernerae UHCC 0503]|nr:hypothetical protein [Halotia wernerae UHCC 0503]
MTNITISNLYPSSEENLLTEISLREMKSVEGGYRYGYGYGYGYPRTTTASNTTDTASASDTVRTTLGNIDSLLGNMRSQIDETMISLRSQFQETGFF